MAPDKTSAKRDIVFIEHRKIKFRLSRFLAAFLFAAFILAPCVAAGAPADAAMTEAFAQSAEPYVVSVDIVPDLTGKDLYLDGSSHTFQAVVTPSSADQRVTWSLRDREGDKLVTDRYVTSADVTDNYSITIKTTSKANESGEVILYATTVGRDANGKQVSAWITLGFTKPEPPARDITLDAETLDIDLNSSGELTATVSPDSAEYTAVTWTISSQDIAQISYKDAQRTQAVIKPLMAGVATVTASVYDHSDTCSLTVTPAAAGITISPSSAVLKIGESLTLTATVTPPDAADIDVTWESSDETVATVDAEGLVSAKSAGTAVITASCVDRGLTSTATITVMADDPAPQPSSGGGGCSIGHGVLALLAIVPLALRKKK